MEKKTMQGLDGTRVRPSELQPLVDSVTGGQNQATHMHTHTDSEVNFDNCVVGKENRIQLG